MDVRIGVIYSPKEIELDLGSDAQADAVQKEIDAALGGKSAVLWLTDRRGRRVGVPSDKVAYVELGVDSADRRMGFVG